MAAMTLAEKVACDFQDGNAELFDQMRAESKLRRTEMKARMEKDRAHSRVWSALQIWIPRLEEMSAFVKENGLDETVPGQRFEQTANEMRKLHLQVREVLDG